MAIRQILACGVAMCGVVGAATGQDNRFYFSPELSSEFSAPSAFDGLYAGALFGPISSRMGNFHVGGEPVRGELGLVVGWNQPVADGLVVGGELQGTVATDFNTAYARMMALARVGFAAGDNTLIYLLGGAGRMGEGWAFEAGLGAEVMVTGDLGLRLEAAGIGQLGDVPSGVEIPHISALRITGGAIMQLDGEPGATNFSNGSVTDFSGYYAGLNLGGLTDVEFNFFRNYGYGWHLSRFEVGAMAGVNWALNDYIRVGVEGQAGVNFDTSGDAGVDALALARLGVVPMEGLFAYAAAGAGVVESQGAYAVGGGAEYALWGDVSLRGEALMLGRIDGEPGLSPDQFPTTKATLGAVWHFE
jgi:hypothetical protein